MTIIPELPEVEVIRRGLDPLIKGRVFDRPLLIFAGSVRYPGPDTFCRELPGRAVRKLDRKGKYLLIRLDQGTLVVHLRMTGRLLYCEGAHPADRHLRVSLPFSDDTALRFSDMRKFGGLWLLGNDQELSRTGLDRLGPDIYEQVDYDCFAAMLACRPRARIKPLLLNQHFVAGLGNIYVDESLHRSRIHPCRMVGTLSRDEIHSLYHSIQKMLEQGIRWGGASMRDYRNARGEAGAFQEQLAVYGRKGLLCSCGAAIERIETAGRGTYLCPVCQAQEAGNQTQEARKKTGNI